MNNNRTVVVLVTLLLSACALPTREHLEALEREKVGLAAIAHACATDPSNLAQELAAALGVKSVQVLKAMGRHTLGSLERGDLCARGDEERLAVIVASRARKKMPNLTDGVAEAAQPWLLRELGGPSGVIDHAGVAKALEQRAALVQDPLAKRAGLPASPAGFTNLTGYTQTPGRINHVLFTSATGNDMLAGSDGGGIWKTTDGGTTWNPVNDFLGSLSIINLAKANNDANTIYAGTNARGSHTFFPFGIIKSIDGGQTWIQVASTNPTIAADFTYVQRISVHPTNSSIVLAATEGGAYITINGGTLWRKIGASTRSYYVTFHPTDGNRATVAYNDGTVRYTTTGEFAAGTDGTLATILAAGRNTKLAYSQSDATRMYALLTENVTNQTRFYTSTTSGASWTELPAVKTALEGNGTLNNNGYLSYTGGLWVDPVNPVRVAICEAWASFVPDVTAVTPTAAALASGWVDFHGIVAHPGYNGAGNKTVFFMDDGGLYKTTNVDAADQFANFTSLATGLVVTQVYSVSGRTGGNPVLGAQDTAPKAYKTATGDATSKWRLMTNTNNGFSVIGDGMTTAASTANPSVVYVSRQFLDLFRSTDGGANASPIASPSLGDGTQAGNQNAAFIAPFVLDPSNPSRMLAGGHSLWRSNDVATGTPPTWTKIRDVFVDTPFCIGNTPINVIGIAPSNPDVAWIAYQCTGKVFKSVNATQAVPTWTEVTTLPAAATFNSKTAITIDAANPNRVWIGVGTYQANTLFRTTDGGATIGNWSAVAGLPGAPVYSLVQHPANSTWLYAGTGVGLFASTDGGATWSTSNEGPANVVVRSLSWMAGGLAPDLLVGTFGRGVWKANVATTVTPNSPRLYNISTRMQVLGGQDVMIAGFIIGGATPKTVVVNVAGPSLVPFGIANALMNPSLTLVRSSDQGVVKSNDDWQFQAVPGDYAAIVASGFQPNHFAEPAVIATLAPGAYTAIVSGALNTTGVGLVGMFEVDHSDIPFTNISTRGQVLLNNDVMIAGFVIQGTGPQKVVINVAGPNLANFGIVNPLMNPTLSLVRSSDQVVLATNDNWQTQTIPGDVALIQATGFQPNHPNEPAIIATLQPGAYTAIVSGVGGTTGVGLVGVFTAP